MTPALVKLSELIFEYGNPDEVAGLFENSNPTSTFTSRDILRHLLATDPYEALSDMVGSRLTLLTIAEKMDVSDVSKNTGRDKLLNIILSTTLGDIYPTELLINGFYIASKAVAKARKIHSDQRYAETYRIVKRVEFLVKHIYQLIVVDLLSSYLKGDIQKDIAKQKRFVPLNKCVETMNKVEQDAGREEEGTAAETLSKASQRLFGRRTPFPGFDLDLMSRFANLRNYAFGHQSTYTLTHDHELRYSSQMIDILQQVCEMMKPIAPQVIIQIYYEQDHLGRNKVYYLEEDKDFDEDGRLRSGLYFREANRWNMRDCKYYCMVPEPRESYRPGIPGYILPISGDTTPYIDPHIFSASDLRKWESEEQE